jgi:hypothetical protein
VQHGKDDVGVQQPAAGDDLDLLTVQAPHSVAADLHAHDVVARLDESDADRGPGGERHLVLGGAPAAQHGDPHGFGVGVGVVGVVGGGVNLPTVMVTFAPRLAFPPLGFCATTLPSWA